MILMSGMVPSRIGSMTPTTNRPASSGATFTRYSTSANAASVESMTVSATDADRDDQAVAVVEQEIAAA